MKKFLFILGHVAVVAAVSWLFANHNHPYRVVDGLGEKHPVSQQYLDFLERYDNENQIYLLSITPENLTGSYANNLDYFITGELRAIPGLLKVQSLSTARYLEKEGELLKIKSFFENGALTEEGEDKLLNDPLWKKTIVDDTRKALLTTIVLDPKNSSETDANVLEKLQAFADSVSEKFKGVETHLLGAKVATSAFNFEMLRQQLVITPLAMLVLSALIFWVLRSYAITAISFYYMGAVFVLTASAIFTFEKGLSPYTQFALLFVFIVALEDFIHLFAHYSEHHGGTIRERMQAARKEVIWPCFLTSLTEALGFAALIISDIEPIRNFGIYTTIGITIAFLLCFYFLPWAVELWNLDLKRSGGLNVGQYLNTRWIDWLMRNRRAVIVTFLVVTLMPAYFLKDLRVDDNMYNKFNDSHPLSKALKAFSNNFQFTGSLDVVIPFTSRQEYLSLKGESLLRKVEGELREVANVVSVRSVSTFMDYIRRITHKPAPQSLEGIRADFTSDPELINIFDIARGRGFLEDYWPESATETKINVRIKSVSAADVLTSIAGIKTVLDKENVPFKIEGLTRLRVAMMDEITWGFVNSFVLCFLSIFGVFVILYQSFRWATIAMIPNVIPAIITMGAVGYFGIEVEDSLILTASILIGVAVNDTIHLIHGVKARLGEGADMRAALLATLEKSGNAVIGTNIVFLCTLPLFFLSEITVFYRLGYFLIVSLTVAVLADIFLTPALLFVFGKERAKNA